MIQVTFFLRSLLALGIGASGAVLFIYWGMSLPWVLGSMVACAIVALCGVRLYISQSWRTYGLATIGTILGSSFDMETVHSLPSWTITISLMLLMSLLYLLCSYHVLIRWSGMNKLTAMFSAMPGGLSIVTALSEIYKGDTRRIALSHSARLVALLALTPVILKYVGQYELPAGTPLPVSHQASSVSWVDYLALFSCGFSGLVLARLMRFPTGILLFPLLFSALAHATGLVDAQVPAWVAALSQAIIGASVGVRFVGYKWRDILHDGWLSIIIGIMLALLSMLAALAISYASGIDFAPLLLVFLPGGAPELGVMALALDINPAMVTTHHMLRVIALAAGISFLVKRFIASESKTN